MSVKNMGDSDEGGWADGGRLLCCWEGRVEKRHLEPPPGSARGQMGTGALEAVRVAIPEAATRHQGRALMEVRPGAFLETTSPIHTEGEGREAHLLPG